MPSRKKYKAGLTAWHSRDMRRKAYQIPVVNAVSRYQTAIAI